MLLRTLPHLDELRICGRTRSAVDALAALVVGDGAAVTTHTDPGEAVDGADVVVTVTAARDPLFPAAAVTDDALVCAVGATKYDRAEMNRRLSAGVRQWSATMWRDHASSVATSSGPSLTALRLG